MCVTIAHDISCILVVLRIVLKLSLNFSPTKMKVLIAVLAITLVSVEASPQLSPGFFFQNPSNAAANAGTNTGTSLSPIAVESLIISVLANSSSLPPDVNANLAKITANLQTLLVISTITGGKPNSLTENVVDSLACSIQQLLAKFLGTAFTGPTGTAPAAPQQVAPSGTAVGSTSSTTNNAASVPA